MNQANQSKPACPRTYLVPSILITLLAFLPVGIAAIIFAPQVESKYNQGDYAGAQSASNTAKTLCIVGGVIAAPIYLLFFSLFGLAIFAPSFTNQAAKAKESEAKVSISSINLGQTSFYLDNKHFGSTLEEIELNFISETAKNYSYQISPGQEKAIVTATAKESGLTSYVGAVFFVDAQFADVICKTEKPTQSTPGIPQLIGNKAQCPAGTSPLE